MYFIKNYIILLILIICVGLSNVESQNMGNNIYTVTINRGDTIYHMTLPTFHYYESRKFNNWLEEAQYKRLVRNVKIVYPYARLAGDMFKDYSEILMNIDKESERREKSKELEKKIKDDFESDLKRLTISQGLILLKLIDRETNNTSYDILKDFRGNFTAVFWQSFGQLFGYNLKTKYEPYGEDRLIEEIVYHIEQGLI